MERVPPEVLHNLDLILARDTAYFLRRELDHLDKQLVGKLKFLDAFNSFMVMFTKKAGWENYVCYNLHSKHSGYEILLRCHDGSLVPLEQ